MPKKSAREKSPMRSVSPPPLPTKARAKRAAAAVASSETADTSALELSPKKKTKKEKPSKSATPSKKDKKKRSDDVFDDEAEFDNVKRETLTVELPARTVPAAGSSDSLSPWRLPGALSPYVDNTTKALLEASFFAAASAALSSATRYAVTQHAISSTAFTDTTGWGALLRASSVQGYGALAASALARLVKHVVGWNDIHAISSLNVLISAPMVYLLSVFYNVPLSASALSELIDFASDVLPVLVYKKWIRPSPLAGKTRTTALAQGDDSDSLRFLLVVLSSALYNFIIVQACRAYLPGVLLLHFSGISTIEPARVFPLTWTSLMSQNSIFFALFQSPSVVAVSAVCALSAWVYIFERLDNPAGVGGLAALKPIALRSLAASITVGLGVFVQCLTGIYGVDATGAALYGIVWTLSPLVVGSIVGYIISF